MNTTQKLDRAEQFIASIDAWQKYQEFIKQFDGEVEEYKMMVIKTSTPEQLQQAVAIRSLLLGDCIIVPKNFGSAFVTTQLQKDGVKMFPVNEHKVVVILSDEDDNELCCLDCGYDIEGAWELAYAIAKEASKEADLEAAVDGDIFTGEARK